jgi:hypothetical protein
MSTEVAHATEPAPKKLSLKKSSKKETVDAKTPVVPEITASSEGASKVVKKSKNNTSHVDSMLTEIRERFNLPEKEFREIVSKYVSKTSSWNKSSKKRRAPGEPKKPSSAYIFYSNEKRPAIFEEMKKTVEDTKKAFSMTAKKLGEMWEAVSEADKGKYIEMAKADKARYEKLNEVYQAELKAKAPPAPVETPVAPKAKRAPRTKKPAEPAVEGTAESAPKAPKKSRKKPVEVVEAVA